MTSALRAFRRRVPPKAVLLAVILAAIPVVVAFCDGPGRHGTW